MKACTITVLMVVLGASLIASPCYALQRKQLSDIDTDQLTEDLQTAAPCGDSHMNVVWWIPYEFWAVIFANDKSTAEAEKSRILGVLKPYSVLAICQADISDFGAFRFYDKGQIAGALELSVTKDGGKSEKIEPITDVDPDLNVMLGMFTPILGAAMGEMGKNLHFYVLKDVDAAGARRIDPYQSGALNVTLATKSGTPLKMAIEMPLNSLYVPRKCPNGKDAHVSWKYCPWTGQKLPD